MWWGEGLDKHIDKLLVNDEGWGALVSRFTSCLVSGMKVAAGSDGIQNAGM